MDKKPTYWQQLTQRPADAFVFWGLWAAMLFCVVLIAFDYNKSGGAGFVLAFLTAGQAVNLGATYFGERRQLRE